MTDQRSSSGCAAWLIECIVFVFLLGVYLITHGTTFGWDDQHLEIPLLKALIDPTLYPRDYYVASLKDHFPSLFYPLLARLIPRVDLIPRVYGVLFVISRGVMFYLWYRTWSFVFRSRRMSLVAVWGLIVLLRVPEFLYRTFSHQEAALALLAGALFALYRGRHTTAALIAGAAANVHALYAGFVMTYILSDLIVRRGHRPFSQRIVPLLSATAAFGIAAFGVLYGIASRSWLPGTSTPHKDWLALYRLACPQNFLFHGEGPSFVLHHSVLETLTILAPYLVTFWLWGLLSGRSAYFRRDRTGRIIVTAAAVQWGVSVVLTDFIPIRFIADLNMIRHIQFMQWVLFAHLIRWLAGLWIRLRPFETAASVLGLFLLRAFGPHNIGGLCLLTASTVSTDKRTGRSAARSAVRLIWWTATAGTLWWLLTKGLNDPVQRSSLWGWPAVIALITGGVWSLARRCLHTKKGLRRTAWSIMAGLFLLRTIQLGDYHVRRLRLEQTGPGFWALQRAWIDMQHQTRRLTPKDALILVPHDMEMGGFRIFSERSVVFSYRDIGIVGFDWNVAREWRRRYHILEPYRVIPRGDVRRAIVQALRLYGPDFIVTSPLVRLNETGLFEKIYTNGVFTLYRIRYDKGHDESSSRND